MKSRVKLQTRLGFTLLELLAVMSIMALLTTLAVTSYFSAISGMARRSAVKHVVNTLVLARQRACMEGARVCVMFFNEPRGFKKDEDGNQTTVEDFIPSYVVSKAVSRLSYVDSTAIGDEFMDLDKVFGTSISLGIQNAGSYAGRLRLYNLTRGGWWMVLPFVTVNTYTPQYPYETASGVPSVNREIELYVFTVKDSYGGAASSVVGDTYGVEASPVGSLPKGFIFEGMSMAASDTFAISFLPDGTLETNSGNKKMDSVTLVETRLKSSQPKITISVDDAGVISYDKNWN
jgi:prepilin-type N-terminal cleavage/methylation domain-containing protein